MKGLFVLAASAAMSVSSVAFAADAVETIPTAPVAVEEAVGFTWSGPYLGVLGGYAWGEGDVAGVGSEDFDGGRFGAFVGYNWQFSNGFVAGIEGDVNYDWNEETIGGVDIESGFSGSVRGRVGYAFDRALIFAAAGYTGTTVNADAGGGVDDDDTLHGWTIGGGLDYAFTDNVFGRVEYRYNDFGEGTLGGADFDFDQHVVNVGIAVKF